MKFTRYSLIAILALSPAFAFAQIGAAEGYDSGGTLDNVVVAPRARAFEISTTPFDVQAFGEGAYGRALFNKGPIVARAEGVALNRSVMIDGLELTATKVSAYAFSQGECTKSLNPDYKFEVTGLTVIADGQPSIIPNPIPPNTTINYGNGRMITFNGRSTSGDGINTLDVQIIGVRIVTPDSTYNLGFAAARVNCQGVPVELQSFEVE